MGHAQELGGGCRLADEHELGKDSVGSRPWQLKVLRGRREKRGGGAAGGARQLRTASSRLWSRCIGLLAFQGGRPHLRVNSPLLILSISSCCCSSCT